MLILGSFFFCLSVVGTFGAIVLENDLVSYEFNIMGGIDKIVDKTQEPTVNIVESNLNASYVWTLKLVGSLGVVELGDIPPVFSDISKDEKQTQFLNLIWENVSVKEREVIISVIDISLSVALKDSASVSEWELSFSVKESKRPIGIWEAYISIPLSIGSNDDGDLFFPAGYGVSWSNPMNSTEMIHSHEYPTGSATMQFMALGCRSCSAAGYVAALDGSGTSKTLTYKVIETESAPAGSLGITIHPEGTGIEIVQGATWTSPYKIAVGVVSGIDYKKGNPLWYRAAMEYRQWVLANAKWTQSGPIAERNDPYPAWYRDNSIWLNTHWQCHDVFNETGGSPSFVLPYTQLVADRLQEPSLALHWYEWQQGPDPAPESRYLFDTHYPDYFPARTDFKSAVKELANANIYTFPYINGRISDVNSDSYKADDGHQYCSKKTAVKLVDEDDPTPLVAYSEDYGSGTTFCVTNPFTPYWQTKIADTVEELVREYNVPGVYIDQIGSAVPKQCWDTAHEHSLGNGDFWTVGYGEMMDTITDRLSSGGNVPIVTEDNAEPYLDMLQGYLSLNAFKASMAQNDVNSKANTNRLAPAFPAIYGGYYVGFGAIWTRADFVDHDYWCSRLAAMFVTGTQLGWFSLAGIEDDKCGPMGVGDLLLDTANDDLIAFLRLLSTSRKGVVGYFVDGHLINPPVLSPEAPAQLFTSTYDGSTLDYDSVVSSSWTRDASVLVSIVRSIAEDYSFNMFVDCASWGFASSVTSLRMYELSKPSSSSSPTTVACDASTPQLSMHGRSVMLLEFRE